MTAGELTGRIAIVTGGGWNIGRAIAEAYAHAGATVILAARDARRLEATADQIRADGGDAIAMPTDVTERGAVERLVAGVLERYSRIDIAAAIAGGGHVFRPIDELEPGDWDRVFRVNVFGTFLLLRAVLPTFRTQRRGAFLICSGGGAFYPVVGTMLNAYACAKAALCRLVDQATAELWEEPAIRVNGIDPGMVWSPATLAAIEAEEVRSGVRHPHRDVARPASDAAELALWLAADRSAPTRGRLVSVEDTWWRDPASVRRVDSTVHLYRTRRVTDAT